MGFFSDLSKRCDQLSEVAQKYLDTLPFISSEECTKRIWNWAWEQVDKDDRGDVIFNEKHDFAEQIIDGGVPYSEQPSNGSLHYSLGWSVTAQDANLRSLLEFVEGRQNEWIKFKCLADLE